MRNGKWWWHQTLILRVSYMIAILVELAPSFLIIVIIKMVRLITLLQYHIVFISFVKWIEFNEKLNPFGKDTFQFVHTRMRSRIQLDMHFISLHLSAVLCNLFYSLHCFPCWQQSSTRNCSKIVCLRMFAYNKMLSINCSWL